MQPRVGGNWPANMESSVLFPDPLGPRMHTISPRFTARSILSSTRPERRNSLVTPSTLRVLIAWYSSSSTPAEKRQRSAW